MKRLITIIVALACIGGISQYCFAENNFSIQGSVMNVHQPDGSFNTFIEIVIGSDFSGILPDDIDSISIEAPSGLLPYGKSDFIYNLQFRSFFISIPGSPQTGTYSFKVETAGLAAIATDVQSINMDIPIPDTSTFTLSNRTFSWGSVNYPDAALYYRLEICDMLGWRVFATPREANMLSYTVPEGILEPGKAYRGRVRVTDSDDFIGVQNRSNSEWVTFKTSVCNVINLHDSGGGHYALVLLDIGDDLPGTLPDNIGSIIVTAPTSGQLPYNKEDFTYNPQWREFSLKIPGSPEIGIYNFTVTNNAASGASRVTLTDTQSINMDIPIPDTSTFTLSNRTFSWGSVDSPTTQFYYRLEICDMLGWRVFATPREANMFSYTVPDGILEPGKSYQWRVRVTDSDDFIGVQNRSNSEWLIITLESSNCPPQKPTLSSPPDGEINVSLAPLLETGEFHDPDRGDTHLKTELVISKESDFSATVLHRTSATYLTSVTLPKFILREGTPYYWRVRFYDNHSAASEWSDAYSFTTVTTVKDQNLNGIPDDRENNIVDLDNDGTADINQNNIKSLDTIVGAGQIGVSRKNDSTVTAIESIDSIDPETISEVARPSEMPLGLFAIRLAVASAGDSVEVVVYFSEQAPSGYTWLMYDSMGGWTEYSQHATFSADRMSVTLELKDGDYGDADGVANGVIVDPGGFGLASWIIGRVYDASTGEGISQAEVSIQGLLLYTTENGDYLSMILPGTYGVSVSAQGYESIYGQSIEIPEGQTVTNDIALNSNLLYFPHSDTTNGWETEIAAINTSSTQTATGTLNGYNDQGVLIETIPINLSPYARRQITISQEFTNHSSIKYLILYSNTDTLKGYTKFYQQGIYRVAVPAVSDINTSDIYISHIDSSANWWTGLSLLNTTSSQKTATIQFNTGETKDITLSANQHTAFTIAGLFGQSKPDIQSAKITNASGIIGLELFGSTEESGNNYLSGIILKDDTTLTIYYPHIASDDTWWTGIVAYNPSVTSSTITITPYTEEGSALPAQDIPIDPEGKYIGTAGQLSLPPGTAWLKIDSTSPITGFELFGTNNENQFAGYTGVAINRKEGVFAKIEKQGWTGIAFVNTEDSQASVTLTAYDNNGTSVASRTFTLGGYAKMVDEAQDLFTQDISSATYISYSSDKDVVGFQLNGSSDDMMLDGLPGM